MKKQDVLKSGVDGLIPQADAARQAVDSLRGYAYQVTAAALAWLDIEETSKIFLEVAEDYAVVAKDSIKAIQVKDTQASGKKTLNTASVREAILNFVMLTASNPGVDVHLRYFTTSDIGAEKLLEDRPNETPGLIYWRSAAKGADVRPLREILESDKFAPQVREFVISRNDENLRQDLFRKIHWDCGKPQLAYLRKEYRDRLTVVCRDTFRIPVQETLSISSLIIHHVLEKSICESPADRVLTRASFIDLIDNASRVSVPLDVMDMLTRAASGMFAQLLGGPTSGLPFAAGLPTWLTSSSDLPTSKREVPRPEIEKEIEDRLRTFGACFVVGASGVGKSSAARAVTKRFGSNYFVVDFRGVTAEEARNRLDALFSRLGDMNVPIIILEDLNHFNEPALAVLSARVFEALSRRDIAIIVTCYAAPTPTALSNVGQHPGCSIYCPYFSEEESARLVDLHGGDANIWGKLAHVSGAFGHPQLVHAFIAGMAARKWPRSEIMTIVGAGLSTGDIAAEREAARRSLITVLPEKSRNLLYRLSLVIGAFSRDVALSIADAPPPLAQAGEAFDSLIGPWIETIGRDSYRVSPLASQSGNEMLVPNEQRAIHGKIAARLIAGRTVSVGDTDKIILHAILGKNESVLLSLSIKLVTSDENIIEFLAENLTLLRVFDTEKLIYEDNIHISLLLRLVQFKVLAAGKDKLGAKNCVLALLGEVHKLGRGEHHDMFLAMILGVILGTMGVANYLDNWLALLFEFQDVVMANNSTRKLFESAETKIRPGGSTVGLLFAIGGANLGSVEKLARVVDQLDKLEAERRALLLETVKEHTPDFSVLINSPWVAERDAGLDALAAAECYRIMAAQTSRWGYSRLTIQCWIARAVMFDEYLNDRDQALKVLDEAAASNGEDVLISRARAKIYWRAQDHERALCILRGIADEVGKDNNVERAFALREAAISAATCNDWSQAEKWFLEAKAAASGAKSSDMAAMSVGLGADSAVAAYKVGAVDRCLTGLAEALTSLNEIRYESSVRAAHCHHLLRHTVLWLHSRVEGKEVLIGGEPIIMRPGICGNPEPAKEIADRPLGSLDITWYLLAEAELIARRPVGVLERLRGRLGNGVMPVLEAGIQSRQLGINIEEMDEVGFVDSLIGYVGTMTYLLEHYEELSHNFDALNPSIIVIPEFDFLCGSSKCDQLISDAILAYVINCACRRSADAVFELSAALDARFGEGVAGGRIFARARLDTDGRIPASSFEEILIDSAMTFREGSYISPANYCASGLRFLQQARRSRFKDDLIRIVAVWQRREWMRIIESERFRLVLPHITVPAIERAVFVADNNESFLCTLILAAAVGSGLTLPREIRSSLEAVVDSASGSIR